MLSIKVENGTPKLSLLKRDLATLEKAHDLINEIGQFYPPLQGEVEDVSGPMGKIIGHVAGSTAKTTAAAAPEGQAAKQNTP